MIPSDRKYTKDHEWVRFDGDVATVGLTDYAQSALGDIVYVELPPLGKKVKQGDQLAVVESSKAASEVYAPVSGTVAAVRYNSRFDGLKNFSASIRSNNRTRSS